MTEEPVSIGERDNRTDDDRLNDDDEQDRVLRGVGEVCVATNRLEGAMAFLAMTIRSWPDEKYREIQYRPGQVMRAYEGLVPELEACGLGAESHWILTEAKRLRDLRNRVVHSVMMFELKEANERLYEAWHAKSDELWQVDPAHLHELAQKLTAAASKVDELGYEWEVRSGRSRPIEVLLAEFLPAADEEHSRRQPPPSGP